MKVCTKCGESKSLDRFYPKKRRNGSYGLTSHCRECVKAKSRTNHHKGGEARRAKQRTYRLVHLERERARTREWIQANPERKRESDRRWRAANRTRKLANDKRWAEANPERVARNKRRYRDADPERLKQQSKRWKAARRGEKLTADDRAWFEILRFDPCCYCGEAMEEVDHITPRKQWSRAVNGWNGWSNLTASCRKCNRHKSAKPLLSFLLQG